jgi:hypothetical protein
VGGIRQPQGEARPGPRLDIPGAYGMRPLVFRIRASGQRCTAVPLRWPARVDLYADQGRAGQVMCGEVLPRRSCQAGRTATIRCVVDRQVLHPAFRTVAAGAAIRGERLAVSI